MSREATSRALSLVDPAAPNHPAFSAFLTRMEEFNDAPICGDELHDAWAWFREGWEDRGMYELLTDAIDSGG